MISVLLFGFGRFGKEHLAAWEATGRARIGVIVDPGNPDSTVPRPNSDETIPVVGSISDIPPRARPDAAAVVTPVWSHAEIAKALLDRKIPFLIEKPLAPTSIEGLEILQSANKAEILVMPGHVMRFSAPHVGIYRQLAERGFPSVDVMLRRDRSAALLDMYPGEHPALLTGIHDIDLAQWFTGARVANVVAQQEVSQGKIVGFDATLQHTNGSTSQLSGSYKFPLDAPEQVSDEINVEEHAGKRLAHFTDESSGSTSSNTGASAALIKEVSHFLDVLSGASTARVPLEDAVYCLSVVEAIIQSSKSKGSNVRVSALEEAVR